MKKMFVLIIALAVIGMTLAPQVQAQDVKKLEQLEKEMAQLEAKVDRGQQLTPAEVRRLQEIQQEVIKAMGSYGDMYQFQPQSNPSSSDGDRQVQQIQQMQQQTLQQQQQMQQQPRQQAQQQGATAGWPSASTFQNYYKISALSQPAGTTVRHTATNEFRRLEIYLTGGNAATVLQNLKQQVEKITKRAMDQSGNEYTGFAPDPNNRNGNIRFILKQENNGVTFQISVVAG